MVISQQHWAHCYVFFLKATLTHWTLAAGAPRCCCNYRANSTLAFNGGTGCTQVEQRITAQCVAAESRDSYRFTHRVSCIIPLLVQYQLTAGEYAQTLRTQARTLLLLWFHALLWVCCFSYPLKGKFNHQWQSWKGLHTCLFIRLEVEIFNLWVFTSVLGKIIKKCEVLSSFQREILNFLAPKPSRRIIK